MKSSAAKAGGGAIEKINDDRSLPALDLAQLSI
jgi:hypothetical protein